MPICYSFATAAKRTPKTDVIVQTRAEGILRRFSDPDMPTNDHLCATLDGEYHYLLRFRYEALYDVSRIVLENRKRFEGVLDRTLTMLEYPDNNVQRPDNSVGHEVDLKSCRGILLIQEQMRNQIGKVSIRHFGRAEVLRKAIRGPLCGDKEDPLFNCIDVFGPFDYVVEFQAINSDEMKKKVQQMLDLADIRSRILNHVSLFCRPFLGEFKVVSSSDELAPKKAPSGSATIVSPPDFCPPL